MPRKTVSRQHINEYMTTEIRKIEDLEDATLTLQYIRADVPQGECNWDGAMLNAGSKGSQEYALPYVQRILRKAQQLFNVDPETY